MNKRILAIVLASAMTTGMLSGCGGSSSDSSSAETSSEAASSQEASSGEQVTLVEWDNLTEGTLNAAMEAQIANYEKANTNVKIERVAKQLAAMGETMKAAFMSGDAPDILYYEPGIGEMGSYVKAGYIMNLADAYKSYGWDKTLMPACSQVPSVDDIIYGVGNEIESMGLYYNQDIFDKLGLKQPTSIEELTEDFAAIKQAGYIPLANLLDTRWWDNMNFIGSVLYAYMSKDEINTCMNYDGTWDLDSVHNAVKTIQNWIDSGYFPEHPEVDGEQKTFFNNQEAVCWINGNWSIGDLYTDTDGVFKTTFIPMPGSETCADGGSQVNFVGSAFMVNAATKYSDEALGFIDGVLNNPESAKIWSEVGGSIPPYTGKFEADIKPLSQVVINNLSDSNISNIAGINMWLGKNTFDFFSTAGQNMVVGALNEDSFIKGVEEARQLDIAGGGTKGSFSNK